MHRTLSCWLIVLSLALPLHASEQSKEPALLVQLKSIDGLIADLKYFANNLGQSGVAEQIDDVIGAWVGDQGIAGTGIDTSRPISMYVLAAADASDIPTAIVIPIADENKFIAFLKNMGIKTENGGDGCFTLDLPRSPAPVFFRFANRCAYVTAISRENIATSRLIAPENLTTKDANSLFSIALRMDRVSDDIKQLILGQAEMRLADLKERKNPDETPEQARQRRQGIDAIAFIVKTLISEGRAMDVHWSVDRTNDDIAVSLALEAMPDSLMATAIRMLGNGKTRFAPASDAALHAGINFSIADEFRLLLNPIIDIGMKDTVAREGDPNKRGMIQKAVEAIGPTLKAGVVNVHLAIGSPNSGGKYNMIAAVGVQEGQKIEAAARDLIAHLSESDRAKIKADVTKVGNISVHQLQIENLDAEGKRLLGEGASAWAGFSKSAIMLGVGGEAAPAFAGMTTNQPAKPAPMFVLEGSLYKLAGLNNNPLANEIVAQVFGTKPTHDQFRLSINGGKQLKLELSFKGRGMKFIQQLNEKSGSN